MAAPYSHALRQRTAQGIGVRFPAAEFANPPSRSWQDDGTTSGTPSLLSIHLTNEERRRVSCGLMSTAPR
jgi:hypothetical protein